VCWCVCVYHDRSLARGTSRKLQISQHCVCVCVRVTEGERERETGSYAVDSVIFATFALLHFLVSVVEGLNLS
jgi:hypothetical protein